MAVHIETPMIPLTRGLVGGEQSYPRLSESGEMGIRHMRQTLKLPVSGFWNGGTVRDTIADSPANVYKNV